MLTGLPATLPVAFRYKKRASALSKELERKHASILEKRVELECFRSLQQREMLAGPQRVEQLTAMLSTQVPASHPPTPGPRSVPRLSAQTTTATALAV